MSLPDPEVLDLLKSKYVTAWRNIRREDYVGSSHGYADTQCAVGTTNGAGARNVQLIMLSNDLRVLSVLPGFWHPRDLARELRLGLELNRLWQDGRQAGAKQKMFKRLLARGLRQQPAETFARSEWQGFDGHREAQIHRIKPRDSFFPGPSADAQASPAGWLRGLRSAHKAQRKPLNLLFKERMLTRAFLPLARFDMEEFTDFGLRHYDLNRRHDKGREFSGAAARARRARTREQRELNAEAKKQLREAQRERRAQPRSRRAERPE